MPAGAARPNAAEASSPRARSEPAPALRALLSGLIDYAGLFPPAALSMREVARNYASYLASPHAWMLGRLVIPAGRLTELLRCRHEQGDGPALPWHVSALVGDVGQEMVLLREWNDPLLLVDSCEAKASSIDEIERIAEGMPEHITAFVEVPVAEDPSPLLDAIASRNLNAKIRTGGVTTDAFPPAAQVARFIVGCAERKLPFKATAGLHHPVRGTYRLTYADGAPRGVMFGFLNVFVAAMLAQRGNYQLVMETLESSDLATLSVQEYNADDIGASRSRLALSFGSCSFTEPVDDLMHLGLL